MGIIPTRVGTRVPSYSSHSGTKDHPHACGDKSFIAALRKSGKGSSPRVWGQALRWWSYASASRIIPTRVGTRLALYSPPLPSWDHPHACGDKGLQCLMWLRQPGSSPRVWGQVALRLTQNCRNRIIPTRVGTSKETQEKRQGSEDHPHACGDKGLQCLMWLRQPGSSPRVWGQVALRLTQNCRNRIIPTRVGTSKETQEKRQGSEDHPHACGDKCKFANRRHSTQGSSPRVWGQVLNFVGGDKRQRIIPTRVGTRAV